MEYRRGTHGSGYSYDSVKVEDLVFGFNHTWWSSGAFEIQIHCNRETNLDDVGDHNYVSKVGMIDITQRLWQEVLTKLSESDTGSAPR
jgi:hypothetical protein